MRKCKIKTNSPYSVILGSLLSLLTFIAMVLSFTSIFEGMSLVFKITWLVIFGLLFLLMFFGTFISIQFAILTEKGIQFKICCFTLAYVQWDNIVKIDCQRLESLYSPLGKIKLSWIILYTEVNQIPKEGGGNWKKPPWLIHYTKKNWRIVNEYARKFANCAQILV